MLRTYQGEAQGDGCRYETGRPAEVGRPVCQAGLTAADATGIGNLNEGTIGDGAKGKAKDGERACRRVPAVASASWLRTPSSGCGADRSLRPAVESWRYQPSSTPVRVWVVATATGNK